MLRITVTNRSGASRTLKLEGRIAGTSVEELRRQCAASVAGNGRTHLILDLADVSFVDDAGIEVFRGLRGHNVTVSRCSPFVAELLKEVLPC